jgi:hypothetical protein
MQISEMSVLKIRSIIIFILFFIFMNQPIFLDELLVEDYNIKIYTFSNKRRKPKIIINSTNREIDGSLLGFKLLEPSDKVFGKEGKITYRIEILFRNKGSHQDGPSVYYNDKIVLFLKSKKNIDKIQTFISKYTK